MLSAEELNSAWSKLADRHADSERMDFLERSLVWKGRDGGYDVWLNIWTDEKPASLRDLVDRFLKKRVDDVR